MGEMNIKVKAIKMSDIDIFDSSTYPSFFVVVPEVQMARKYQVDLVTSSKSCIKAVTMGLSKRTETVLENTKG